MCFFPSEVMTHELTDLNLSLLSTRAIAKNTFLLCSFLEEQLGNQSYQISYLEPVR